LMLSQVLLKTAETSWHRIRIINQDVCNLFAAGLADSVDLLDADLRMERALRQIDEHETAANNASFALTLLVHLNPNSPIALTDSLPGPDFSLYENWGLGTVVANIGRPELKVLECRSLAAKFAADAARASFFPSLSGFAGYSYGKPNKDIFNRTWNDYWSVGLNVNWEWNLGGQSAKSTQAAREVVQSALMARADVHEGFILQAKTALSNLGRSYRSYQASRKELHLATQQFRLARTKQQAGTLSTNRLLELESDLETSEERYQADIISFFLAEAEFLRAIGSSKLFGGF